MTDHIIYFESEEYYSLISEKFGNWLRAQNAFKRPERLRRYQEVIARTGNFSMPHPLSDDVYTCSGTIYAPQKAFLWRFQTGSGTFWLTSSGPNRGFEISGIIYPDCNIFVSFNQEPEIEIIGQHIALAQIVTNHNSIPFTPHDDIDVKLLVGHPNFAHFAWNELPALLDLENENNLRIDRIYLTSEPIAPFEQLLHWKSPCQIFHVSENFFLNTNYGFQTSILFSLGSTLLTHETKNRIFDVVGPAMYDDTESFVIWLSLRLIYRHAHNEIEVWARLITALSNAPFKVTIFLDGYSLPDDIGFPGRHDIKAEVRRGLDVANLAEQLISNLSVECREKIRVLDLTRLPLANSIAMASRSDFYICHHGTQQHKVGWFYAVSGIIHAPPAINFTNPAHWVQKQSEGSLLPNYLPMSFVEADDGLNTRRPGYDQNYYFIEIESMIKYLLDSITASYHSRNAILEKNRT